MAKFRTAVDTGGTFTDIFVFNEESGEVHIQKVPSTPDNPSRAITNGMEAARVNIPDVTLFSHGTNTAKTRHEVDCRLFHECVYERGKRAAPGQIRADRFELPWAYEDMTSFHVWQCTWVEGPWDIFCKSCFHLAMDCHL